MGPGGFVAPLILLCLATFVFAGPVVFIPGVYDSFTLPKQAVLLVAAGLCLLLLTFIDDPLPRNRPIRYALLTLAAAAMLSFLLSTDMRSNVLGQYQYRQGVLTELCLLALFVAAVSIGRRRSLDILFLAGLAALVVVVGYATLQETGHDPFPSWIDTSQRPFGTLGNANEFAAFVLLSIAYGGFIASRLKRWRTVGLIAFAAVISFALVLTESRGGLVAVLAAIIGFPLSCWIVGITRREAQHSLLVLLIGLVIGAAFGLLTGALQETSERLSASTGDRDLSIATRLAYWEGTIAAIADAPITGHGPDSLFLAFPRVRPADLGGLFEREDLIVQSSHNWFLDQAAKEGMVGLLALLAFLGLIGYRSLRYERQRASPAIPYLWSGIAAYFVFAQLNHLSLAVHAIFFLLLGVLVARSERGIETETRQPLPAGIARPLRLAGLTCLAGFVTLASLSLAADRQAKQGWDLFVNHRFEESARHYALAVRRSPFERNYREGEARSWLAGGACEQNQSYLRNAEGALIDLKGAFQPSAGNLLDLAAVRMILDQHPDRVEALVQEAERLDPHGRTTRTQVVRLRRAAADASYVLSFRDQAGRREVLLVDPLEAKQIAAVGCKPVLNRDDQRRDGSAPAGTADSEREPWSAANGR